FTTSGGYLDGAILNDNLTLSPSAYVRLIGGSSFTGANLTLGNSASIYWEQSGTLSNKTISLGSGAYIYLNGVNNALTFAPGTTVYIRGNFSNNGTITAQNSGVLFFDGTNSSGNLGNIVIASGGHARLNGTVNNTNLTAPTGGTFELYGGTIAGGNISASALS